MIASRRRERFAAVLCAGMATFAASRLARAQTPALNVGAIEVLGLPGPTHLGLYPYVAGSVAWTTHGVNLIPAVGVEWSPEFGRWGLTAVFTADYPVGQHVGIDLNLAFIHDQAGTDFQNAFFLLGLGPGASIFFGRWTFSPSVNLFRALNADAWALVPALNVAFALTS